MNDFLFGLVIGGGATWFFGFMSYRRRQRELETLLAHSVNGRFYGS